MAQKAIYDLAVSPTTFNFPYSVPAYTSNILSILILESLCCLLLYGKLFPQIFPWLDSLFYSGLCSEVPASKKASQNILSKRQSICSIHPSLFPYSALFFSQNILSSEILHYIICLYIYWLSLYLDCKQHKARALSCSP